MEQIGSKEIVTQKRIIRLFEKQLHYSYQGDWTERTNSNVEESLLEKYLFTTKAYSSGKISSAINLFMRASGNIAAGLYHANKEVYGLLRYGVNVSGEASENKKYVQLIDWKNPSANNFIYSRRSYRKRGQHQTVRSGDLCQRYSPGSDRT